MLRYRFGLILAACLVSVTSVRGEEAQEPLPTPPPPRESIPRGNSQEPAAEHIVVPEVFLPASPQPILSPPSILSPEAEFGGPSSFRGLVPTIVSVHEFDRPPLAYSTAEAVRISRTRFEVDVVGLDPTAEYRLLACFDGETIGRTDWVVGRASYTISTQVGFPPGNYDLTVYATRGDASGSTVQTPAVSVNYQPTYLREMRHLGGRDVTAVASRGSFAHGRLADEVQPRQIQVRFVSSNNWHVLPNLADADQIDLETAVIPGRRNFAQGRTYQLKYNHQAGEIYPTLEIPRASSQAAVFLAHSSVAVELQMPEVEYVANGGLLTKVMYLPHRAEGHPARANCVETLVSRCPGDCTDPLAEAARNGTILAILRVGDKDLE